MVSDEEITSSLMFPTGTVKADEGSLKKKLTEGLDPTNSDLNNMIDDNLNLIRFTNEFYHKLIIGNLVCGLKDSKEVYLQLEKTLFVRKDKGEFNMPYLTSRVASEKAELAMIKFGKKGTKNPMTTEWASVQCTEKGIEFTSEENTLWLHANDSENRNRVI